jgi:membrane protein DedA with SNARE-associated domain
MIEAIAHWITNYISTLGYPAIFVLMTLESALIPIPSEVTMPFAGFLVSQGYLNFWLVVLIGTAANLFGSLGAYALGFWGQEKFVKKIIKKYGKYVLVTYDEVETAEKWFRKRGELIAFASRLLPVVRTFISLPAGFSEMNVFKFSFYTFLGAFIWTALLTWVGFTLGERWDILGIYFHKFDTIIIAVFIVLAALYVYRKVKKIKKSND